MSSRPEVSVVVPVLDGEAWIERSLRSALAQTCASLEVLVVDDGCTDRTMDIASALAAQDSRVRLLRTEGCAGPGAARNVAFDAARGRWIACLDADDCMHPKRLERLLSIAQEEQAVLVADNQRVLTEDLRPDGLMWPWITRRTRVDATAWVQRNVWHGPDRFGYGYAKVLVRRDVIESPRLRMRPELKLMEDYHFVLALLRRGHSLLLVPEPMYDYTVRASSSTHATVETVLAAVLQAGDEVMREVEPGPLRDALQGQQASVQWRAVRFQVMGRLRARDLRGAARLMARHPACVPYVMVSLRDALVRRLQRLRGGAVQRKGSSAA